jgi:hypothetical protein
MACSRWWNRARAVFDRIGDRAAVDTRHGQPIVEEHQVEATFFECPTDLGVVRRVEVTVLGGGVTPRTRVNRRAARLHEGDECHLSSSHT